jgi:hypothetical protein
MRWFVAACLTAALLAFAPAAHADLLIPTDFTDVVVATSGDDFTTGPHAIGFTFPFFGMPQTSVFMNSNGNLTFGSGSSSFTNTGFPTGSPPRIAPFWEDLFLPPGDMRINTSTPGVFVATWNGVGNFSVAGMHTFQAILLGAGNPYGAVPGTIVFSFDATSGGDGSITMGLNKGDVSLFSTAFADLGIGSPSGLFTPAQVTGNLDEFTFFIRPTSDSTYTWSRTLTTDVGSVPEPTSLSLLGVGLACLGLFGRKSSRREV